jgi:signal transduction histidine kinase
VRQPSFFCMALRRPRFEAAIEATDVLDHSPATSQADRRFSTATLGLVSLAGVVAGIASGFAVANSDVLTHPIATGVARGLTVASAVSVGCYMAARRANLGFAGLLIAAGFVFGLGALVASTDPRVFALGRIVLALLWVLLFYLFLSFPAGRIEGRAAHRVMITILVMTALLWVPVVLFAHRLPLGGGFLDCRGACPPNGLMVLSSSRAVGDGFSTAADVWSVVTLVVTAILVAGRLRGGSRLVRRALAPPLLAMCALLAITALRVALSRAGAGVEAAGWAARAVALALPFSFLLGMAQGRLLSGDAARDLLGGLGHDTASAADTRDVLARALDDPTLRLAIWLPESRRYIDAEGATIQISEDRSEQAIWQVSTNGQPLALIIHDPALDAQPDLAKAATNACRVSLENARLEARLWASIRELRDSRERIVSAADAERRRIERDLHDGTQLRLIALQLRLALLLDQGSPDKAILRQLEAEVDEALDELSALVHGIFPPVLAERGLVEALKAMALSAPIRTRIDAQDVGRLAPEIELAIYFCCNEAVQNTAKHAGLDATALIRLREDAGRLEFEVRDDGRGFEPQTKLSRSGLTNMRDRVGAAGGELQIHSAPGRGTTILGSFPHPRAQEHGP